MDELDEQLAQDILGALLSKHEREEKHEQEEKPFDAYQMTEMLSKYDFNKRCAFEKGDWVTPKEGSNLRGHGRPFLVVHAYGGSFFLSDAHSSGNPLCVVNMVVASGLYDHPDEVAVWNGYSDNFEKYQGLVYGDGGEA